MNVSKLKKSVELSELLTRTYNSHCTVHLRHINLQTHCSFYLDALQKSTRFFDAMRSGVLSDNEKQRVPWRGNAVELFLKM